MAGASFAIDARDIFRLADGYNRRAGKIVRDELATAMTESTADVEDEARANINHKSGKMGRSFRRRVLVSSATITGIVENTARSKDGFNYPEAVEHGRGPVVAIRRKALRFEIGGTVLFRKRVGPAPAQFVMRRGLESAKPRILGRHRAARDRIVTRLEAL